MDPLLRQRHRRSLRHIHLGVRSGNGDVLNTPEVDFPIICCKVLAEDGCTNRMHESLSLFASVANSIHFRLKAIIIFFNKRDLFQEKLDLYRSPAAAAVAVRKAFKDYHGDGSFDDVTDFIINRWR